jgi:hypothetical protein
MPDSECIFFEAVRLWWLTELARTEDRSSSSGVSKFAQQICHQPSSILFSAKSLWLLDIIFSPSYIGEVYLHYEVGQYSDFLFGLYHSHCVNCKLVTQQLNKHIAQCLGCSTVADLALLIVPVSRHAGLPNLLTYLRKRM